MGDDKPVKPRHRKRTTRLTRAPRSPGGIEPGKVIDLHPVESSVTIGESGLGVEEPAESALDNEDSDIRSVRMREHRGKRVTLELEGRMASLVRGELSIADMDNEELARMQFKDRNGKFTGRPPKNLPAAIVNLMRKELIDRVSETRRSALVDANRTLIEVIRNENAKDADRIKAALALIEREEGKVPDKVELSTGGKPFEVALSHAIRRPAPEDFETAPDGR